MTTPEQHKDTKLLFTLHAHGSNNDNKKMKENLFSGKQDFLEAMRFAMFLENFEDYGVTLKDDKKISLHKLIAGANEIENEARLVAPLSELLNRLLDSSVSNDLRVTEKMIDNLAAEVTRNRVGSDIITPYFYEAVKYTFLNGYKKVMEKRPEGFKGVSYAPRTHEVDATEAEHDGLVRDVKLREQT